MPVGGCVVGVCFSGVFVFCRFDFFFNFFCGQSLAVVVVCGFVFFFWLVVLIWFLGVFGVCWWLFFVFSLCYFLLLLFWVVLLCFCFLQV